MNFDDVKKAIASEWLKILLILAAMIGGWYSFDFRIRANETSNKEIRQKLEKLVPTIEKLDNTLDRINQTMRDFPPHRHVDDEDVIYPGDAVIRDGRSNGKR